MSKSTATGNIVNINLGRDLLESSQAREGESVNIQITVSEFRALVHDAENYRKFGADLIDKAKKWDSQHPAVRQILEDYQGYPLQIIPY